MFLVRVVYSPLKNAAIIDLINKRVPSNIRATTLSTYQLLIRIPFVIFGVYIGSTMKAIGVRNFSSIFVSILLVLLILYFLVGYGYKLKREQIKSKS